MVILQAVLEILFIVLVSPPVKWPETILGYLVGNVTMVVARRAVETKL